MKDNILKCKVCGGKLEIKDVENSILICRNCGSEVMSEVPLKAKKSQEVKPQVLLENISLKELQKKEENRKKFKILLSFSWGLALLSILFVLSNTAVTFYLMSRDDFNIPTKIQFLTILLSWGIGVFCILLTKINFKNYLFRTILMIIGIIIVLSLEIVIVEFFILKYI